MCGKGKGTDGKIACVMLAMSNLEPMRSMPRDMCSLRKAAMTTTVRNAGYPHPTTDQ